MSEVILKSSSVVLEDLKLVIDIYDGVINLQTFKAHKQKQIEDNAFSSDYNLLSDFKRVTVDMVIEELDEYAKFVEFNHVVGVRKAAVVLGNLHQMVYTQAYNKSIKNITSQTLQIMASFDEAFEFLGLNDSKQKILDVINYYRENPRYYWSADGNLQSEKF
jgi:hypothetical protein